MFSTLSSFLPSALQSATQEKEKPPIHPTTSQISAPQPAPAMAVDEQGMLKKRKERTHESFIVVRPPPSKSNHPLNLQVQLVPPTSRGPAGTNSRRSIDDPDDTSLSRTTSNRSDVSGASGVSGYSSVTSFSTVSSTSTTSGGRRMIIPLYNLQAHNVMTNVIVDAGTDAKIAKFMKRGLEVIGLALLEPVEVSGGIRYEDSAPPGSYLLSPDGLHTPTSSRLSLNSENTNESLPPQPSAPPAPAPPPQERAPSGARKLFGKVFKRKENGQSPSTPRSPVPPLPLDSTPRAASKRSSLLLNPPLSAASHTAPDTPTSSTTNATVLGIQPSIRAPSPGQARSGRLRPTSYVWVVQRWLKASPEGLPVESLFEVRFDWSRGAQSNRKRRGVSSSSRAKRNSVIHSNTPSTSSLTRKRASQPPPGRRSLERSPSPRPDSVHTTTTTTDEGSPRGRGDEDDDESDPEDSETPWTCHLVVRRRPARHGPPALPEDDEEGEIRVKVAAVVPAPHHPKVVSLLKVPFPLPDIILAAPARIEARRRVVTPQGVARPADGPSPPGTPTQAGIGKLAASAGNLFGTGAKNLRPGNGSPRPASGEPAGGILLSAEEIKDAVCCTALWLIVREGFGGVGRVSRKGDGWRIRG